MPVQDEIILYMNDLTVFYQKHFNDVMLIVLQEHARKALDVLWQRRQRGSDLVGTVINIHNEEWVRRGEAKLSY